MSRSSLLLIAITALTLSTVGTHTTLAQEVTASTWGGIKALYGEAQATPGRPAVGLDPSSLGAWTSIAWPFPGDDLTNWRRWDCENYPCGGSMGTWCGQYIHSHSGADHYARDLSRKYGITAGRAVHAGLAGKVVYVGPYGAGTSVVIYYASQRLCIRYAHLSGTVAVRVGDYVGVRQYLGKILDQGSGSHLHLVAYENVPAGSNGNPQFIPGLCNRDNWHACRVFFFS